MVKIMIDNVQYEADNFSDELKAEVDMLQRVERRIAELNADLAITQTAKIAYSKRVNDLIETESPTADSGENTVLN